MKIYKVGGCVRDALLGRKSSDEDFVVVGSFEQEMLDLGFTRVGADFPVFLHPQTKQEYALARQERKNATGYLGFSTQTNGVTLEQDLARRDLTINAIAQDVLTGEIVDPYNGTQDLQNKVIRHVSDAFVEDPVRVLRIGRFLAKLGPGWTVHADTLSLIADMRTNGLLDELVGERIWKELARGLEEQHPQLMLDFFNTTGVFKCKSLATVFEFNTQVLDYPAQAFESSNALFAFAISFKLLQSPAWIPKEFKQVVEKVQILKSLASFDKVSRLTVLDKAGYFKSFDLFKVAYEACAHLEPIVYEALLEDMFSLKDFSTKNMNLQDLPAKQVIETVRNAKLALMA